MTSTGICVQTAETHNLEPGVLPGICTAFRQRNLEGEDALPLELLSAQAAKAIGETWTNFGVLRFGSAKYGRILPADHESSGFTRKFRAAIRDDSELSEFVASLFALGLLSRPRDQRAQLLAQIPQLVRDSVLKQFAIVRDGGASVRPCDCDDVLSAWISGIGGPVTSVRQWSTRQIARLALDVWPDELAVLGYDFSDFFQIQICEESAQRARLLQWWVDSWNASGVV